MTIAQRPCSVTPIQLPPDCKSCPATTGLPGLDAVLSGVAPGDNIVWQIQSLEDEVGLPLFLRHTRAVELTTAGMQLLQAVGQAPSGGAQALQQFC